MNGKSAITVMSAPAPGVDRNTQAALYRASAILSPRTPVLLPLHQLGSNLQFLFVNIGARSGQFNVLEQQLHRIHLQLGCQVFKSAHGYQASLRMIGSAPGPCWTSVGADVDILLAVAWDINHIGHGRSARASRPSSTPGA